MGNGKKIGRRFFATYLCIALPFLTLSILLSTLSMEQLRKNDEAQLEMQVSRISAGLDDCYRQYRENSVYLSSVPELAPSAMLSNAISAHRGIRILETVYAFDQTISDLLLYYDDAHVYGSSGMARAKVYLNADLKLPRETGDRADELLKTETSVVTLLKKSANNGFMLLHFPIHPFGQNSQITVNYLIDFNAFAPFLQGLAGNSKALLLRLTFLDETQVHFGSVNGTLRPVTEETFGDSIASGGWIAAAGQTEQMGAKVELWVNEHQLYANVSRVQYLNYLLLAIGMLLSGLLCGVLTNRRMIQLKNLENAVRGQKAPAPHMGEFSNIHALIQQTMNENISTLSNFRTLLRNQTAQMLFHGLLKGQEEYEPLLRQCGIELAEDYVFVTAVWAEQFDLSGFLEDYLCCASQTEDGLVWVYLDELPNQDDSRQLRRAKAEKLFQTLKAAGAEKVKMVLSVPTRNWNTIDFAYLHTLQEMGKLQKEKSSETFVFADASTALQAHTLSSRELNTLSEALAEFNAQRAGRILEKMLRQTEEAPSSETRQYLRCCAMQPLLRALSQSENPSDSELLQSLEEIDTANQEKFHAALLQLTERYCTQNASEGDREEMLRFLEENYQREDLSLDEMAAHFGVSREHMSRLFRARTGMRYMDCITQIRMEKAWQLITTTEMPIAEIFRQVGYIDRSNSTKKFKKYFGVTPAEARRQEEPED